MSQDSVLLDRLQRPLQDLRLSVTDQCNFRCHYCMPSERFGHRYQFLPQKDYLSFAEIERLIKILVSLGLKKVKITGGEPLLRPGLDSLIRLLKPIEGLDDLALITNGYLLESWAPRLKDAGLNRLTVSLDTLDDQKMSDIIGGRGRLAPILKGLDKALELGFAPIKINMLVKKGMNQEAILPMARYFRHPQYILRFIEYMDVGSKTSWNPSSVLPSAEILALLQEHWDLEPLAPTLPGETAKRYCYTDGQGEVGFISSVTQTFCSDCSRLRLTADGHFYTCLFSSASRLNRDLWKLSDQEMREKLIKIWGARDDRYSDLRREIPIKKDRPEAMHRLGG